MLWKSYMLRKTHKPIHVTQQLITSELSVLFYRAVLPNVAWFYQSRTRLHRTLVNSVSQDCLCARF